MNKVIAFITALVLFLSTAYGLHRYSLENLALDNNAFSTWSNETKFGSPDGIKANLNKDTLVVFGSSEFQHGNDTIYHPKSMFQGFSFNPMLIGAGYYQSLSHAITLASIGDSIPNKKVVLLLSPTWFRKDGVKDGAFASRFSEMGYLELLKNKNISPKTKDYIIGRVNHLLKKDPSTLKRVNLYQRVLMEPKRSMMDEANYRVYEKFLTERNHQGLLIQMKLANLKSNQNKEIKDKAIDWNQYLEQAQADGEKYNKNPFYMDSESFQRIKPKLDRIYCKVEARGMIKNGYTKSPEYDDLRCFLDICKELNIKPMIIALPVNGYWFDYNGFPPKARAKYYSNIHRITEEYGVKMTDLSNQEFTKYFFKDGVHLGGKGWVTVNECIYHFYQENEK